MTIERKIQPFQFALFRAVTRRTLRGTEQGIIIETRLRPHSAVLGGLQRPELSKNIFLAEKLRKINFGSGTAKSQFSSGMPCHYSNQP